MLFDPARHEPLRDVAWNEGEVRATIARIVGDTEAACSDGVWPVHPSDADEGETGPQLSLYFGAAGVVWALHYLQAIGATQLTRSYATSLDAFRQPDLASYLFGDTPVLMMQYGLDPRASTASHLQALIAGNVDHPARELMWGAPGTMLAALFLHERTGDARWAELFRTSARTLWTRLEWSPEHECHYWTQDLYGHRSTYLDAVHGFVATALPLIRGRRLLDAGEWTDWQRCIANTIRRTATREGGHVNWRLLGPLDHPVLYLRY